MAPKRQKLEKASTPSAVPDIPTTTAEWKAKLADSKVKNNAADIKACYEHLVTVYPLSAPLWTEYAQFLLNKKDFEECEKVFKRSLHSIVDAKLFEVYIRYIQAVHTPSDPKGLAIVQQAYEFAISKVQNDRFSGVIFQQFIQFLENRPSSTTWEQQHKMDEIRKTYRKAVALPVNNIEPLWRAYNAFENGISRATARKFIDERSGVYMQARSCFRELDTLSQGLVRQEMPKEREFDSQEAQQLAQWRRIVAYEASNPLNLDDVGTRERVMFTYKQALASCCYFPELWYDAIQFCLAVKDSAVEVSDGLDSAIALAQQAVEINPLSFALGVRLATLYEEKEEPEQAFNTYRNLIASLSAAPISLETNERLTQVYVELMQATKRTLGVKQARQISAECRKLDACTYQMYTASAAIEYQNGDIVAATKIYDIAYRRFRSEPRFIQCYLEFLFSIRDMTNARVVFEKALNDISLEDARPIYDQFLRYEASYADLTALRQLEERYRKLYDVDLISLAAGRYRQFASDPIGDELHLKPVVHKQAKVPSSIQQVLAKLPTGYDGPAIDVNELLRCIAT